MWNNTRSDEDEKKVIHWQDFPAGIFHSPETATPQIAAHLRRILERYEESEFIKYLVVPSPMALSGHFHCSERDIYDALDELHRQGYEYETAGKTGPITLWDPLIRRKSTARQAPGLWSMLCACIAHPVGRPVTG